MNFAAIDFETANEKRSSACSVGVTVVKKGKITDSHAWLIQPEPSYFRSINTGIHGLTAADVAGAPDFATVWYEVAQRIGPLPLVAHNASFDMSVIRHGLDLTDSPYPNTEYLCTMLLAKRALPQATNHRLNTLSDRYGIALDHHDALSDATACALLLLALTDEFSLHHVEELRSVMEFGRLYSSPTQKGYQPARLCRR